MNRNIFKKLKRGQMIKRCIKCGKDKNISEFYKKSKARDGHTEQCKNCGKKYSRDYYAKNREKIRNKVKIKYRENPENKAKKRAREGRKTEILKDIVKSRRNPYYTHAYIGKKHGISREYVRQLYNQVFKIPIRLLKRRHGTASVDFNKAK